MFVVKNKDFFKMNSDVHSFNTRSHYDLHILAANLAVFQKGVRYSGIKIYNHLPSTLKQLSYDISKFKEALTFRRPDLNGYGHPSRTALFSLGI